MKQHKAFLILMMASDRDDFYIVLPSNSQPDFHPSNRADSFRVTFNEAYNLGTDDWEVALKDITFVNSLYNIIDESYTVYSYTHSDDEVAHVIKEGNVAGQHRMLHPDYPIELIYKDGRYFLMFKNPTNGEDKFYGLKPDTAIQLGFVCPTTMKEVKSRKRRAVEAESSKTDAKSSKTDAKSNESDAKSSKPDAKSSKPDAKSSKTEPKVQAPAEPPKPPKKTEEDKVAKMMCKHFQSVVENGLSKIPVAYMGRRAYYPHSKQITATDLNIYTWPYNGIPFEHKVVGEVKLKQGYYSKAATLVTYLNDIKPKDPTQSALVRRSAGSNLKNIVTWHYDNVANRISVNVKPNHYISLKNGLHDILGFKSDKLKEGRHEAEYSPLLNRGIYTIMIYCSLCAPIQVGNVLTPLIRTVKLPAGKKWGTVQNIDFPTPMYVPVHASTFNSIQIEMRDDTGQPIVFAEGKTNLTLHFRRRARL